MIIEKSIITLLVLTLSNANLILNGNFESPQIPNGNYSALVDNWTGANFILENKNRIGSIQGQYIDLRYNNMYIGNI